MDMKLGADMAIMDITRYTNYSYLVIKPGG